MPDFSSYLESVRRHYEQWWSLYTLTDAEGRDRAKGSVFDFGLMVQTAPKSQRIDEDTFDAKEPIERFTVLEGLRKYAGDHVLLVGRPGSGKSTALARLLLEEAEKEDRIPVLVELRYWNGDGVLGLIQAFLRSLPTQVGLTPVEIDRTTLEGLLRSNKFLLLMDGLNELPSEAARLDVLRFRREFPKMAIVFTTRDLSVGGDFGIEKKLEMQPLTETQMKQFVMAYLPEQSEAMLRQLGGRLREFGSTPLLLWMLCGLFRQTGEIPANLGSVFRAFTTGYERSLKADVVLEGDRRWWAGLLQALAARMMIGDGSVEFRVAIDRAEMEAIFTEFLRNRESLAAGAARKGLEDLLRHHLIQTNGVQVEFRHQLIQEYYAAEWLLVRVGGLDDATLQQEFLNYLKWTEPVALMLALVEDEALAVRVVELALDVDLMLGARLAGEVRSGFQERTVALMSVKGVPGWMKHKLSPSSLSFSLFPSGYVLPKPDLRKEEALVNTDHLEASISNLIKLVTNATSDRDDIWRAATVLGKIDSDITIPALLDFAKDFNSDLRWRAVSALGTISAETVFPSQRKILLDIAVPSLLKLLEDSDLSVRLEVVDALGEIGSDNVIEDLLKLLVNSDSDDNMRYTVLSSLGKIGSGIAIPELLKLLVDSDSKMSDDAAAAAYACLRIAGKNKDPIEHYLPDFLPLVANQGVYPIIRRIQSNCKFYNYEIHQQAKIRKADRPSPEGGRSDPFAKIEDKLETIDRRTKQMADQPKNNFSGATFSGPVNLGDNPTGDFVGTQNNHTTDPEITSAIADLKNLITDLQTQHPTVTTEAQAIEIIDAEFIEIQQNPHHKLATLRKQILNPERHAQAFKAAIVDYAKTTCEKSPLIQASITYFDKLSETPDRGA